MSEENQLYDKKSLKVLKDGDIGLRDLAGDCVRFANASGGRIDIGIEDDAHVPPPEQHVTQAQLGKLQKMIPNLTLNVAISVSKVVAENEGEFLILQVFPSRQNIAATSDGQYYLRVADESRRLMPEDLSRLMSDKSAYVWEAQPLQQVARWWCANCWPMRWCTDHIHRAATFSSAFTPTDWKCTTRACCR